MLLHAQQGEQQDSRVHHSTLGHPLSSLPLIFRQGTDPRSPGILYQGSGGRGRIGFMSNGVRLGIPVGEEELVIGMEFAGSNPGSRPEARGGSESGARIRFIRGADRQATDVVQYSEIVYRDLYDGIDLRYYGTAEALKYDYVVAPGADPSLVRMRYEGIDSLVTTAEGDLEIVTARGRILERRPYIYQMIDGKRRTVEGSFRRLDSVSCGFEVDGEYDRSLELVIDPVILEWSTFIGGATDADGYAFDMATDAAGNIYGTGRYTASFPTTPGIYDASYNGEEDCYVFKLNSEGSRLEFATYIGGALDDIGRSIAVDSFGTIYIAGTTKSIDFPVTPGAYQGAPSASTASWDGFVTRLSADGRTLLYSTRLGGSGTEDINRIRLGEGGVVTVVGYTLSVDFPFTPTAYVRRSQGKDLFITRLDSLGASLYFSSRLGGLYDDVGTDLAITAGGETVVVGSTASPQFPVTAGAFSTTPGALDGTEDAFVLRLSNGGSILRYSTFLGGTGADLAYALVLGPGEEPIVTGETGSDNFPVTANAYGKTKKRGADGFVTILDATASGLQYSTFFGGTKEDQIEAIVRDRDGSIYIAGRTTSGDLPVSWCAGTGRQFGGGTDINLARFSPDLDSLYYSGYIGGQSNDYNARFALGGDNCTRTLLMTATTHSPNYPTTPGAYQQTKLNGGIATDQPVAMRIKGVVRPGFSLRPNCLTVTFRDTTQGECIWNEAPWKPTSWRWDFGDGTGSSAPNPIHTYAVEGTYTVKLVVACPRDSISVTVSVAAAAIASPDTRICRGDTAQLSVTGGSSDYRWSPASGLSCTDCAFPRAFPDTTTLYVVSSGGLNLCSDTVVVTVDPRPLLTAPRDTTICSGGSIQLVASGTTPIEWTPADHLSCTSCPAPIASPPVTTTYIVSTRSDAGCVTSDSVTVFVESPTITIGSSDTTICYGDSVRLTAAGAGPFEWSPAEYLSCTDCASPVAFPSTSTLFTVTTRSSTLCSASAQVRVDVAGVGSEHARAHIGRDHLATPGETKVVPVMLDDVGSASPIGSLDIDLTYDGETMRVVDPATLPADAFTRGTLLEGWAMTVETITPGRFHARFDPPAATGTVASSGTLLNLSFLTYVRPNPTPLVPWRDSSLIRFELTAGSSVCRHVTGEPGLLRLELCGLAYRLIEGGNGKYALDVGTPNPFGESAEIGYSVGLDGPTSLVVYDAAGHRVATLIERHLDAGSYTMNWDAANIPAGIYYIRMVSGEWSESTRMVKR
jgi:PKD repeat protein